LRIYEDKQSYPRKNKDKQGYLYLSMGSGFQMVTSRKYMSHSITARAGPGPRRANLHLLSSASYLERSQWTSAAEDSTDCPGALGPPGPL